MSFPSASRPRQAFSHEQLLQLCGFYRNLLAATRDVQHRINDAITEFSRTQHGRPSEPLAQLLSALSAIDANVRGGLLDEIMQVELLAMKWELKSGKLRSEAKRQARRRAERRSGGLGTPSHSIYDEFGEAPSETPDEAPEDIFEQPSAASAAASAVPPVISPTMALAQRGMAQLPADPESVTLPDTSFYRKSGLV